MSSSALSRLLVVRWRAPKRAGFVRSVSTSQESRQRNLDIIRRLRMQERIAAAALDADIDDFLQRLVRSYTPISAADEAAKTALRQNKYVSTERLSHIENIATIGQQIVDHFNEYKKHIKDLGEEPYPEWQPGDSDVVLRQLDDTNLNPEDMENDMNTREKDVRRMLDKAEKHYEALLKTQEALREKGLAAAEVVANDFINSNSSDYTHISAPLDPVDLDTIDEDTPAILAALRRKTP